MFWDLKSDHSQEASQFPYRPLRLQGKTTHHVRSPTTQRLVSFEEAEWRESMKGERERPISLSYASHSNNARHMNEGKASVLSLAGRQREDSRKPQQPETPYCPSNLGCSNHPS